MATVAELEREYYSLVKPAPTGRRVKGPLPGAGVRVQNPDGSFSSERTIGVNLEGREYVIPTLIGGQQFTTEQAVEEARRRGLKNYPSFGTVQEAEVYAQQRTRQLGKQLQQRAPRPQSFDPEGSGYDYESARKAGLSPDETGHWQSRDPQTGLLLKGRKHETWDLLEQGEREAGYEISRGKGGRYYSHKPTRPTVTESSDTGKQQRTVAELEREYYDLFAPAETPTPPTLGAEEPEPPPLDLQAARVIIDRYQSEPKPVRAGYSSFVTGAQRVLHEYASQDPNDEDTARLEWANSTLARWTKEGLHDVGPRDLARQGEQPRDMAEALMGLQSEQGTPPFLQKTGADWLGERLPFLGGLKAAGDIGTVISSLRRLGAAEDSPEKMDPKDYWIVANFLKHADEEQKKGFFAKVLSLASEMPAFITEFVMTGGAFMAGKTAAKKYAKKVVGGMVQRKAVKAGLKTVPGKLAVWGATKAAPALVGVGAQTAVNIPLVARKVAEKWMPEFGLTQNEADQLTVFITGDDPSFLEALGKGFGAAYIEMGSERTGAGVGLLGKAFVKSRVGQALAKMPLAQRATNLKAALVKRFLAKGGTAAQAGAVLRKGGWHGMIGEVFEEKVADIAGGVTGIEKDYGATGKLLANDPEGWEQLGVEALAFAMIPAGQTALGAAQRFVESREEKAKINEVTNLLHIISKGWVTGEEGEALGLTEAELTNRTSRMAAIVKRIEAVTDPLEKEKEDAERTTRQAEEAGPEEGLQGEAGRPLRVRDAEQARKEEAEEVAPPVSPAETPPATAFLPEGKPGAEEKVKLESELAALNKLAMARDLTNEEYARFRKVNSELIELDMKEQREGLAKEEVADIATEEEAGKRWDAFTVEQRLAWREKAGLVSEGELDLASEYDNWSDLTLAEKKALTEPPVEEAPVGGKLPEKRWDAFSEDERRARAKFAGSDISVANLKWEALSEYDQRSLSRNPPENMQARLWAQAQAYGMVPPVEEPAPEAPGRPVEPTEAPTPSEPTLPAKAAPEAAQEPEKAPEAAPDYSGMTVKKLTAEAKRRGMKGYGGKNKAALVEMLGEDDRQQAAEVPAEAEPEAKEPWQMTQEEHAIYAAGLKPKPNEHLKINGVTVIQNPTDADYRDMSKQAREQFPGIPRGEATTRYTRDKKGNKWIWLAHEATHTDMDPRIAKVAGEEVNQNFEIGEHRLIVKQALAEGKPVPPEVLANYPDIVSAPAEGERVPTKEAAVKPFAEAPTEVMPPQAEPIATAVQEARIAITDMDVSTQAGEFKAMEKVAAIAEKHGVNPNEVWMDSFWEVTPRDITERKRPPRRQPAPAPEVPTVPLDSREDIRNAYEKGEITTEQALVALGELGKPKAETGRPAEAPPRDEWIAQRVKAKGISLKPRSEGGRAKLSTAQRETREAYDRQWPYREEATVAEEAETPKTKLQQAAEKATQDAKDELDVFGKMLRGKGLAMSPMFDPEIIAGVAKLTAKFAKAGTLKFAAFLEQVARTIGQAGADRIRPVLESEWEKFRKTGEVSEMEAIQPQHPEGQAEKKPPRPEMTGIKKKRLELRAAAMGEAPLNPGETVRAIELVEEAVARLTPESDARIRERASEVLADPRQPITLEEAAAILASVDYHRRKADEATDRHNEHKAKGADAAARRAEAEEDTHRAALRDLGQAARLMGTHWAHMGHIYQLLVDTDGQAYIERLLTKANGGEAKPGDSEWAKKHAKKLDQAKKRQAKRGKQIDEQGSVDQANEKIAELEGELKRERTQSRKRRGSRNRIVTQKAKDAAVKRIQDRIKKLKSTAGMAVSAKMALEMLPDAAIVATYTVEAGVRRLAEFSKAMIDDLGDWVKPHLNNLHRKARAEYAAVRQEELRKRLGAADDLRGQHRAVAELAKEILAETQKEDGSYIHREELIDRLHKELKQSDPNITRRDTQDLFSGYGNRTTLSDDDLEVAYRDRRGEARELSKIDRLRRKLTPDVSGQEMHPPSDEERGYHRQVRELKKVGEVEGWYHSGEGKLKSTLDSQKTRLENEISDMDAQIVDGKKTVKGKSVPLTDDELQFLREVRSQRKEVYDEVFGVPELTDEERAERYERYLEWQIETIREQLATRNVFPKAPATQPTNARIRTLKDELEAVQAEKKLMRKALDPNYETNKKLAQAERQAEREVAKLEKEQAEGFTMKEKPEPLPETERLKKARAKLRFLREQRRLALEDEYALKAAIAQSKRNAANIRDRIARGDFEPKKRKQPRVWDDAEWKQAKLEEKALRDELAVAMAVREWENSEFIDKAGYWTRIALALHKAWIVSIDASFLGIQGGFAMYTNPRVFAGAIVPSAKAMASADARALIDAERIAHPDYEKYRRWGLALSEHGEKGDTTTTEFFPTDKIVDAVPGVAFSERGFSTFLNELRFNTMQALEFAYSKPDGRPLNDKTGRAMVALVNALTFAWKPKTQKGHNVLAGLGYVFWAPSLYVGRLHVMTAMPAWKNRGADMRIRRMAAQQLIKGYVGVALTYYLFRWLWGDDDDEIDLRSADTGKVKRGDTRVDVTSGLGQNIVLGTRILTGKIFTATGEERAADVRKLLTTFGGYKLNPAIQATLSALSRKDAVGRPVTGSSLLLENITPLSVQTAIESFEEHGIASGIPLTGLGVTGKNVQIYDPSAPKSEETLLATTRRLAERIVGKKPSGLEKEELKKWLKYKVDWKTDLSKARRYLTPKQMERAEARVKERKGGVLSEGLMSPPERPKRAKFKDDVIYQESLERYQEKVKSRKKDKERLREMIKALNLSHAQAQQLLVEYWRRPNKETGKAGKEVKKGTTHVKDKYRKQGIALAKLYGATAKAFWASRTP